MNSIDTLMGMIATEAVQTLVTGRTVEELERNDYREKILAYREENPYGKIQYSLELFRDKEGRYSWRD